MPRYIIFPAANFAGASAMPSSLGLVMGCDVQQVIIVVTRSGERGGDVIVVEEDGPGPPSYLETIRSMTKSRDMMSSMEAQMTEF